MSSIVTGVIWRWLMYPDTGINLLFDMAGIGFLKSKWYAEPSIGIIAVSIPAAWQMTGYTMALFLATLRGISSDLREAAAMDGATGWQYYRYVAFPACIPTTYSATVILGMLSLRTYDLPAAMTGGAGPNYRTDLASNFMFETAFQQYRYSLGAAIASLVIVISIILLIPPYLSDAIRFIILAFFAIYFIMPIYLLAITSFKPFEDISFATMWNLPKGFYLDGITQAWTYVSQNFMNSIIVTLPASLLSSILGSFNGYLFAKWRFPGSRWLFLMVLFGIFLPYQGILIPLVQVLGALDLYGKYAGLIIVHIVFGIPITTLIFRGYYSAVPDELVDAARIDGAGVLGVFRHIMLPLAMPAFGVSMIWQ
ncbi:MAG: ABC transporter permease subunit, partial [Chloroflexi bacterium]|nr:ABC transporter permease subunit [Chloroflexota bacterium]